MKIIAGSINLDKIPEDKIKRTDKGSFVDVAIIVKDEPDQYEKDVALHISQSKEERIGKVPRIYIGNGKTVHES